MHYPLHTTASRRFISAFCIFTVLFVFTKAEAQIDVPRIISYQGQVTAADGIAISGTHKLTVTFYSDRLGKNSVWQGVYDAEIASGIFTIILGSGKYKLPEPSVMNRHLWVGVRVDGGEEMRPLSQFTTSPYALNVPDKSITRDKLADELLLQIFNSSGHTPTAQATDRIGLSDGTTFDPNGPKGTTITVLHGNATGAPAYSAVDLTADVANVLPAANGGTGSAAGSWLLGGNILTSATAGTQWLGSSSTGTANKELWVKTNGKVAMRFVPATLTGVEPNIIGGSSSNIITDVNSPSQAVAVEGSAIAGGLSNTVGTSFSFVGGGKGNLILHDNTSNHYPAAVLSAIAGGENNFIKSEHGFIGGGYGNLIDIGSDYNVVGGGRLNQAGDNLPSDSKDSRVFVGGGDSNWAREELSVIVGGYHNKSESASTFIGGGESNIISHESDGLPASLSAIVGGKNDTITAQFSFVGGGKENSIGKNSPDSARHSNFSVIAGGEKNKIFFLSDHADISGGYLNVIDTGAKYSSVGSGHFNRVRSPYSVIAGGDSNVIHHQSSSYSVICGGLLNGIDSNSAYNVICGGSKNYNRGAWSLIGAGARNLIFDNSLGDLIGAGRDNYIGNINRTFNGKGISLAVIAGGDTNTVAASWAAILGGKWNLIGDNSDYSVLAGGKSNTIDTGSKFSAITGGLSNQIRSPLSVINGGNLNLIDLGLTNSVIGGGLMNTSIFHSNFSTISGGDSNITTGKGGVIGGGTFNTMDADLFFSHTGADWGTIGGGYHNLITKPPFSLLFPCDPNTVVEPIYVTIAGGAKNIATGHFSSIIGGYANSAYGMGSAALGGWHLQVRDWQTACGRYNSTAPISSWLKNSAAYINDSTILPILEDHLFMVGNGTTDTTRSNAFTVSQNGHSTAYQVNRDAHSGGGPAILGSTFSDNVLLAAADVEPIAVGGPTIHSDFAVWRVTQPALGVFIISIRVLDPLTINFATINNAWITATLVDTSTTSAGNSPGMITVSPMQTIGGIPNSFVVKTYNCGSCALYARRFMFHVFGRP